MSLKEQLSTDAITMLNTDELAIEATYTKSDSSEVSIKCLIDSLKTNNLLRGSKDIEDSLLAHTNIDFKPEIYDKVTIDGEVYRVMSFDIDDLFTSLNLSKNKRPTGKNYGFRD